MAVAVKNAGKRSRRIRPDDIKTRPRIGGQVNIRCQLKMLVLVPVIGIRPYRLHLTRRINQVRVAFSPATAKADHRLTLPPKPGIIQPLTKKRPNRRSKIPAGGGKCALGLHIQSRFAYYVRVASVSDTVHIRVDRTVPEALGIITRAVVISHQAADIRTWSRNAARRITVAHRAAIISRQPADYFVSRNAARRITVANRTGPILPHQTTNTVISRNAAALGVAAGNGPIL